MTATFADAGAATSLEDLLARSGPAAVALSGADQSAWNGQVIEATGESLGVAHWDGTLYLGERILDPLRQMYERSGENQPTADLVTYRESLATILHEHAHFLGPAGADQEAARGAFTQPGGRQLEEGVTEAWARDHLNDFLTHLGVDKVAPGIKEVHADGYYPAFVPAVRILTTDLENRASLPRGQVLNTLNRQTAEGQFSTLVNLLYTSTDLPNLDSPSEAAHNRHRLESVLRESLSRLDAYQHHPPGHAAARSRSITTALLTNLQSEITTAESSHHPHPTACTLPTPTPTQSASATARSGPATPTQSASATAGSGLASPTATHSRRLPSEITSAGPTPTPIHTALSGLAPPTPTTPGNPNAATPLARRSVTLRSLAR